MNILILRSQTYFSSQKKSTKIETLESIVPGVRFRIVERTFDPPKTLKKSTWIIWISELLAQAARHVSPTWALQAGFEKMFTFTPGLKFTLNFVGFIRLGTPLGSFGVLLLFFKLEKKKRWPFCWMQITWFMPLHAMKKTGAKCHQQRNCPFNKTHSLETKISWSRDIVCGFYPTDIFHSKKTKIPQKCSLRFPQEEFSPMARPGPAARP